MANNILDLRMGVDAKLTDENISKLDVGALSYSVDKQNLYIDALKEDKTTTERQQLDARRGYGLKYPDEEYYEMNREEFFPLGDNSITFGSNNIAIGKSSLSEGFQSVAIGEGSHAEGKREMAKVLITGTGTSFYFSIQDGKDYLSLEPMGRQKGPIYIIYKNNIQRVSSYTASESGSFQTNESLTEENLNNAEALFVIGSSIGDFSHSEGVNTLARGEGSHAEGYGSSAIGSYSHAEGHRSESEGIYSHAEGYLGISTGAYSHAEGNYTKAEGNGAHAEGRQCKALGDYSHAEGYGYEDSYIDGKPNRVLQAGGDYSHAEGQWTWSMGDYSHVEGYRNQIYANGSHAEGRMGYISDTGTDSHIEGSYNISTKSSGHVEGTHLIVSSNYGHAEGNGGYAEISLKGEASATTYSISSTFGTSPVKNSYIYYIDTWDNRIVAKIIDIDLVNKTITLDKTLSSEEPFDNSVFLYIYGSLAESAHSEGEYSIAEGVASHAEGTNTIAKGEASHAEGSETIATGYASHAEGYSTQSSGDYSHSSGIETIASGEGSSSFGAYNKPKNDSDEDYLFTIGNGTSSSRSNVFEVDYNNNVNINGNTTINGQIYAVDSTSTDNTPKELATVERVQQIADSIITDVWYRGSQPPQTVKQAKLLWIRYDANDEATYGKGVLYYFNPTLLLSETLTNEQVANETNWIPMSAIYT